MKMNNLFLSMMIILLISCSNLLSQDWPQFRGTGRDSKVTGFKAPNAWPGELKQVWNIKVGFGDATPALSGKRIYLAVRQNADEVILCLDAETGKELWRGAYPLLQLQDLPLHIPVREVLQPYQMGKL